MTSGPAADAAEEEEGAAVVVGEAAAVRAAEHRAVVAALAGVCRAVAAERGLLRALPRCRGPDRRRLGGRVEVRAVALRAIGHQRAGCPRPVDQAGALETVLAQEISLTGQRLAQARVVRAQALAPGPVLVRDPEPVQEELPVHDLVPADARRAAT